MLWESEYDRETQAHKVRETEGERGRNTERRERENYRPLHSCHCLAGRLLPSGASLSEHVCVGMSHQRGVSPVRPGPL